MRLLLFILMVTAGLAVYGASPGVAALRSLYYQAPKDKAAAQQFLDVMNNMSTDADPLMVCYKGMAQMLKANFIFNPYHKLAYFSKGKALIERAVKIDPANVEIRFLRFCAQTNAPFFLGYNTDINKDKAVMLGAWKSLTDNDLKEKIKKYLLGSEQCSKEEKSIFYE